MKCSLALTTLVGLSILVIDRFFKFIALALCQEPCEFTSFFSCSLSFNRGVSWGLFSTEHIYGTILLFCVISSLIAFLTWLAYQRIRANQSAIAEVIIIAGALGNLIDRLLYGAVVDFVSIHYQTWYFPTFNIADIAITVGVGILLMREWFVANAQ